MIHGRHARPFPEAIPGKRGEQWDIRLTDQLLGMTDMAGHRMTVPTGLRRRAFSVRLQQLAHAAQSPIGKLVDLAKKNEVNPEDLALAEEARINFGIVRNPNIDREHRRYYAQGILDEDQKARYQRQTLADAAVDKYKTIGDLLRLTIGTMGTQDSVFFLDQLREAIGDDVLMAGHIDTLLGKARRLMEARNKKSGFPPFPRAVDLARMMTDFRSLLGDEEAKDEDKRHGDEFKDTTDLERDEMITTDDMREKLERHSRTKKKVGFEYNEGTWGKMRIQEPELVSDYQIKRRLRKLVSTETGVAPGRLERILQDERVFYDLRRVKCGTVLIDASGSMGVTPEDVYKLVLDAPAVTVAYYSGDYGGGDLVIVAKDGKLAEKWAFEKWHHGGNIVDGPALQWLASQKGPRIWVSDGQVTGVSDAQHGNLREQALKICIGAKISRIPDFQSVQKAIRKLHRMRSDW
jgi:hypothetical protein